MERIIYLIRHGEPLFQTKEHYCIGLKSDLSLSNKGCEQAKHLSEGFQFIHTIYSSNLRRSKETAELILGNKNIVVVDGLEEVDVGTWEGMTFKDIQAYYPQIYKDRGVDWGVPPLYGETLENASKRGLCGIWSILERSTGDIGIVTHDGLIRSLVWKLEALDSKKDVMPKQEYGAITVLCMENDELSVIARNRKLDAVPSKKEMEELFHELDTPETVCQHCVAVAAVCKELYDALEDKPEDLSKELLVASALLHDICRREGRKHPNIAEEILRRRGYLYLARIVGCHHDIQLQEKLNEEQILYLADKLVQGTKRVTIEDRFMISREKCKTKEALEKNRIRFQCAQLIQEKIKLLSKGKA